MGMEALARVLEGREDHVPNAAAVVREWRDAAKALNERIESYLAGLQRDGRVTIGGGLRDVYEQGLGGYTVEDLKLTFPGVAGSILVAPVGIGVVGVFLPSGRLQSGISGQANLSYGSESLPIVRDTETEEWLLAPSPDSGLVPLTEQSLETALLHLIRE